MIRKAVSGCDGVLTVLAPWGVQQYSSGTAQAVLDHTDPDARLVFSCGWHITRDGKGRRTADTACRMLAGQRRALSVRARGPT